jgi:hypothetical protein
LMIVLYVLKLHDRVGIVAGANMDCKPTLDCTPRTSNFQETFR